MPLESHTVIVDGLTIHLQQGGAGPPLLYLHGSGGPETYHPHLDMLAQHFSVYAPTHPGWGESQHSEDMDTMLDYALFYDGFLRELKLGKPVLVGHSLGGWMAAEFACIYPERFAALCLISAAGLPPTEPDAMPDFFAAVARGGEPMAKILFHNPAIAAQFTSTVPTPEDILRRYRSMTATARISWHIWNEPKLLHRLGRISVPASVVWGAHDGIVPVCCAYSYAAAIPGATLTILENCAHMPHIEDPAAICDAVTAVFERAAS